MKCEQAQSGLQLDVDGELPARRQSALQRHLAECAACRETAEQFSQIRDAMRRLAVLPTEIQNPKSGMVQSQPRITPIVALAQVLARSRLAAGGGCCLPSSQLPCLEPCPKSKIQNRRWRPWMAAAAVLAIFAGSWWVAAMLRQERTGHIAAQDPPGNTPPALIAREDVAPVPNPSPVPRPDPRSLVQVQFDSSTEVIAVPKPTRNPNVTVLWVYPAVRTAEGRPSSSNDPKTDAKGAHT